jgi:hypothetical protein
MNKKGILAISIVIILSFLNGCLRQEATTSREPDTTIPQNQIPEIQECKAIFFDPGDTSIVQFYGYATDQDGDNLSYAWSITDGFTSYEQSFIHEFNTNGIYYATLIVVDQSGATDTQTITINVIQP